MNPQDPNQPASQPAGQQPQAVYVTRSMNPQQQQISEAAMARHKESLQKYPELNLSKGEYIVSATKRHPIGLFQIWFGVILAIALLIGFLVFFLADPGGAGSTITSSNSEIKPLIAIVLLVICILALAGGMVGTYVYQKNTFYLTNESVIQNIQISLFNKREQTVCLENIEDASYLQTGLLTHIFNFGSIRLSTEGEETTYRMNYVSNPKQQIAILNNAVEAFKNGLPVGEE